MGVVNLRSNPLIVRGFTIGFTRPPGGPWPASDGWLSEAVSRHVTVRLVGLSKLLVHNYGSPSLAVPAPYTYVVAAGGLIYQQPESGYVPLCDHAVSIKTGWHFRPLRGHTITLRAFRLGSPAPPDDMIDMIEVYVYTDWLLRIVATMELLL
jgi:hypothetical protein